MSTQLESSLTQKIESAAQAANLTVFSAEPGEDSEGHPTARFRLGLAQDAGTNRALTLELSDAFDFHKPELLPEMTSHLREEERRLHNPRPDVSVTLAGLPIRFSDFRWPFHHSTSGADSFVVHGTVHLEDGRDSALYALIAASMTVTFAEIVPAPEQPYAETFIYNAVRKRLDQGQLELIKSGNRQPVPVTTRYYSRWRKKFSFTDTTEASRQEYLALKVYWLSGALGNNGPVWVADPRDAQYLNSTEEDLLAEAANLDRQGLLKLEGDAASATPTLMAHADDYRKKMEDALEATKPTFNEEMRHGHTNM